MTYLSDEYLIEIGSNINIHYANIVKWECFVIYVSPNDINTKYKIRWVIGTIDNKLKKQILISCCCYVVYMLHDSVKQLT